MGKCKVGKSEATIAMGDWLNRFQWMFFVTLTFARDDISVFRVQQYFNRYLNEYPADIIYFYVFELHSLRVSPHIHLLIGETNEVKLWKHGITKVLPYDDRLEANYYVAKHITSKNVWWDISESLISKAVR